MCRLEGRERTELEPVCRISLWGTPFRTNGMRQANSVFSIVFPFNQDEFPFVSFRPL